LSEDANTPILATLPGRLREWANHAIGPAGSFVTQDLTGELWQSADEGRLIVGLLDDAASAIADLIEAGCTPLMAANWLGTAFALSSDRRRTTAPNLMWRLPMEDAASLCQRLRAALALPQDLTTPPPLPELRKPADTLANKLIESFLRPLQSFAESSHQLVLIWPHGSFLSGDPPHEVALEQVELLGPARILLHGPHLPLPAGWWEAELQLFFSDEACRRTFVVEMVVEEIIGMIRLKPTSAGTFRTRMMFHNPRADHPVGLRVVLEHGAIEGRIGLESVRLRHSRSGDFADRG